MSHSSRISYILDRIQGFSTNVFYIPPSGSTTAQANSIINFVLPANTLIDTRSFALHFDAEITSASQQGRLCSAQQLISRYEVKMGGTTIQAGCNSYGTLVTGKHYLGAHEFCNVTEHAELVRAKSPYTTAGTDGITSKLEVANTMCIHNWDGFLGSVTPSIIPSDLVGDIHVSIHLAENVVCVDASNSTTYALFEQTPANASPVYKLSNIYASISTVAMADGTYNNIVNSVLQQKGHLELPFKNYVSFEDSVTNAMRFQLSASSLDRLWVVHRDDNYNTASGAIAVAGYLTDASFNGTDFDPVMGYSKEKFVPRYFNYPEPLSTAKYFFQLNGANIPNWNANIHDMFVITKKSLPDGCMPPDWSMVTYRNNYCVFCLRLNLDNSEKEHIISGLDTRGISMNGWYNIVGNSSLKNVAIFAETTAVLRIGQGQQADVVL